MSSTDLEKRCIKDPDAVLDYSVDPSDHPEGPWLADGEAIVSAEWEITGPDSALVEVAGKTTHTDTRATIWLEGGTLGADYEVTCHFATNQGREDDRTLTILVRQR